MAGTDYGGHFRPDPIPTASTPTAAVQSSLATAVVERAHIYGPTQLIHDVCVHMAHIIDDGNTQELEAFQQKATGLSRTVSSRYNHHITPLTPSAGLYTVYIETDLLGTTGV